MIYFAVTREHAYTLRIFLESWGRKIARQFRTIPYEELLYLRELPRGTYIFSDLERLSDPQLRAAAHVHDTLVAAGLTCLNHPGNTLRRFQLQKKLRAEGINHFDVYHLPEGLSPARFPVFVRHEDAHDGNLTPLLHTPQELADAVDALQRKGEDPSNLMVVEFLETVDGAGLYRKFGAMRIGERIVPRHVLFSHDWMLKIPKKIFPEGVAEERHFQETNPHEAELRRIFDLAGIQYGRMDYTLHDGRIQVWEINTNPVIMVAPCDIAEDRLLGQYRSGTVMAAAFEELAGRHDAGHVEIRLPDALSAGLGDTWRARSARALGRGIRQVKRVRLLQPLRERLKRTVQLIRQNAQEPSQAGRLH